MGVRPAVAMRERIRRSRERRCNTKVYIGPAGIQEALQVAASRDAYFIPSAFGVAATQGPAIGVESKVSWSCGQILSPSPNATDGASRATRREAGATGFDCRAGASYGVSPPAR